MVVLDSSFLIALERDAQDAWLRLEALAARAEVLRVPAAAWVEYLFPMDPATRLRAVEALEAAVTFEPFTRALADSAARMQHELRRAGTPLAWHDLQIAATALHYGEGLVSNDTAFDAVPGLARLTH